MELRDYLDVIRTRKWVIIQAVVIVTITALVFSFIQPKMYEGEARILISESDTGAAVFGTVLPAYSSQPERDLQTQVQLMQVRPLAESVVRKLGLEMDPQALVDRVEVDAIGDTNIVSIRVRAADPERATDIANALADEYVAWSRETKRESLKNAADEVEARLGSVEDQILEIGRRIENEGKSDELSAELAIATGTYTTLAEKYEQLLINQELETGSGRVVSPAVLNPEQVAPEPTRNGALGFAVGLLFGVAMAFVYEYLDNTIKSTDEAEKLIGAPVLGHIPLERFEKGEKRRLTVVAAPGSAAAESYRVLRNSLDFINFEKNIRTLIVTSAAPAEGKSTVSANLAASLAQAGQKVVMVSCDFRRPTTEAFFGVSNVIGLSDVLTGAHSLKAALQRTTSDQLLILTSGKLPPNPAELLGSLKMKELIQDLEEWADWVIIDTPPLLAVADPASVAKWADGVLLVTRGAKTTRDEAKKAVELLTKVGAKVVGAVVWGLEEGRSGGYGYYKSGYYYYSGYYSQYQSTDAKARGGKKAGPGQRAGGEPPRTPGEAWVAPVTPIRRFMQALGKVMTGVLAFLVVLAIVVVIAYFLDRFLGLGIVETVTGFIT